MDTQNEIILEMLQSAAGREIPMPVLATASGSLNIHTRCWELRRKKGVNILNRTERDPLHKTRKLSFYRLPVETVTED